MMQLQTMIFTFTFRDNAGIHKRGQRKIGYNKKRYHALICRYPWILV